MNQAVRFRTFRQRPIHVLFVGGTSPGRLAPGIALAERLAGETFSPPILFAHGGRPIEQHLVREAGFDQQTWPCHPLPERPRQFWSFVQENLRGYHHAGDFLREHRVLTVVGLGGYASVAPAWAALRCGVPLVLIEPNAVPQRATRWLASHASAVCLAFPQAADQLSRRAAVHVTGNPVRADFHPATLTKAETPQLVVLGGSDGADALNEHVPAALGRMRERLAQWRIFHLAGSDVEATRGRYARWGLRAKVVARVSRIADLLRRSQLAVSRAGGTMLAELAAVELPAVLIPDPDSADAHQQANARILTNAGATVTVEQTDDTRGLPDRLSESIARILGATDALRRMTDAMHHLHRPHAAADITALIHRVPSITLPRRAA